MTKLLKVFLTAIMIILCCLASIQLPSGAVATSAQPLLLDHSYIDEHATLLKETDHSLSFPNILILFSISAALSLLFPAYKIRRYIYSFIPIFKRFFLLYPIKYESRNIDQHHFNETLH
ncbi:hypothetical protein [Paenibacillus sp. RC67]|uniref:hypothetical protein n=1 Tax=Paenibacillus sp. RC67 TaxID=3039392 RepID=UPI0024ACE5FC|nr:hypothetical protein [Paenibacillus sp. RC67]